MKISSSYLFDSALRNLQSSQTDVARSREQLASGKNLVRASDDTSKLRSIETLESYLKKLDSFDSNLSYLKDRLNLEEGVLGSASDILMRIKELSIQAANDTMSSTDLDIIATEARNLREELFSIANTRDVEGNYVFSGSRTENPAYSRDQLTGQVSYEGDNRQSKISINETRDLEKNRDGQSIFQSITRSQSEYSIAGISGEGNFNFRAGGLVIEFYVEANASSQTVVSAMQRALDQSGVAGSASANVTDGVTSYSLTVSGQHAELNNGVLVTQGNSETNALTVSKTKDQNTSEGFFSVLGDFVAGLESGDRGKINRAISEITILQEDMAIVLGDVGSAINNLDRQSDINSDTRLRVDQLLSGEKDLDYAQAVTKFNQEMVRLEATQASFAKLPSCRYLNLFNQWTVERLEEECSLLVTM